MGRGCGHAGTGLTGKLNHQATRSPRCVYHPGPPFGIPAKAVIQGFWTPAFAGVTMNGWTAGAVQVLTLRQAQGEDDAVGLASS